MTKDPKNTFSTLFKVFNVYLSSWCLISVKVGKSFKPTEGKQLCKMTSMQTCSLAFST